MKRRQILGALSSGVSLASLSVWAQPSGRRIGILSWWAESDRENLRHFDAALAKLGYVEGRNIAIEYHFAAGLEARADAIALDLVRRQVDVIVARATPAILAARRATTQIPIVMAPAADPLATGLVASLARPGGNITGLSARSAEATSKRLGLTRDLLPQLRRAAFLGSSVDPNGALFASELVTAGRALSIEILPLMVAGPDGFAAAFAAAMAWRAEVLFVQPLFADRGAQLLELSLAHRLPMIGTRHEMARSGLMSYGSDNDDQLRRAAHYVDRIFRGTPPADLPVEEPTRFELVVNLAVARKLGIDVPSSFLRLADEVIE